MSRSILMGVLGVLALGAVACGASAAKEPSNERGSAGSLPGREASTNRALARGTRIEAIIQDSLSSRINKAGETLRAIVSSDVQNASGLVVIPAGSVVSLTIAQLDPGNDQIRPAGRLSLVVTSVTVNGEPHAITATLEPVAHHLQGRGITKDEVERIGAGTAIGAVAGRLIGKSTKSTVIGGAAGAIAGTAVAVHYAYRDVIVTAGTPIGFRLAQPLSVWAK
jgi:hypothetical protein